MNWNPLAWLRKRKDPAEDLEPARGVGALTEAEARILDDMVRTFARARRPAIVRKWSGRPELGGEAFMIVHCGGDRLCSKVEQAIRRMTRKGTGTK